MFGKKADWEDLECHHPSADSPPYVEIGSYSELPKLCPLRKGDVTIGIAKEDGDDE